MADDVVFDLAVVGAGPGGYVAAIRAAQLGMRVVCVDKNAQFGGTCLRVGCIPSKALLDASEKYAHVKSSYAGLGIVCENVRLDLAALMKRKTQIVEQLTGGIGFLFKKNKIEGVVGTGRFISATELEVETGAGKRVIRAKNFLIATGSAPVELPFMRFDGKGIVSSDQAIALGAVPETMVVVGAGAIGLELGSVWSRLGAKVTVLEMLPVSLGGIADEEATRGLEKILKKQGMTIYTGAKVTGAKVIEGKQQVTFEWEGSSKAERADVILVAVGRRPYTEGLGLEKAGVELDERKRIKVGAGYATNVANIYAIGDVIAGPMLAHKAEEEGMACVETLAGKHGHVNYGVIPGVVYTNPELAWVGLSEEQCKEKGVAVNVGRFKFSANGRALCMGEAEGFVKVIAEARTDRVLGVHILGPQASSLIAEAAAVMEFGGAAEDIARTCHAHPSLPEAVKEAAMAVAKRAIHA